MYFINSRIYESLLLAVLQSDWIYNNGAKLLFSIKAVFSLVGTKYFFPTTPHKYYNKCVNFFYIVNTYG